MAREVQKLVSELSACEAQRAHLEAENADLTQQVKFSAAALKSQAQIEQLQARLAVVTCQREQIGPSPCRFPSLKPTPTVHELLLDGFA